MPANQGMKMPRKIVSWECETCGTDFGYCGYEEARNCELGHIVDAAVAKTKLAIRDAFKPKRPLPTPTDRS